jgi:hypothetical protein
VEDRYVSGIFELIRASGVNRVLASKVEYWEHDSETLASIGLGDVLDGSAPPDEGEPIAGNRLENAIRRCLRELAWLEITSPTDLLVHFGYDLRVFVASTRDISVAARSIRASGLFVYPTKQRLRTLEEWRALE